MIDEVRLLLGELAYFSFSEYACVTGQTEKLISEQLMPLLKCYSTNWLIKFIFCEKIGLG